MRLRQKAGGLGSHRLLLGAAQAAARQVTPTPGAGPRGVGTARRAGAAVLWDCRDARGAASPATGKASWGQPG